MLKKLLLLSLVLFISSTVFAQKKFDRWWDKVEQDERAGLSMDAYEKAEKILKKADRKDNPHQFIKAFLYVEKFKLLLKDNSLEEVHQDFVEEIGKQSFPVKNILSSYLAESLTQYYNQHRYRIRNRTKIDSIKSAFTTWDQETFQENIDAYYELSLTHKDELIKIPLSDYKEILSYGDNYGRYRSSLLDLLAFRYLKAIEPRQSYSLSKNSFLLDEANFFSLPQKFSQLTIKPENTSSKRYKTLKIYQALTQAHVKENNSLSVCIITLDRFKFLAEHGNYEDNQAEYLKALKSFLANTTSAKEKAWIAYHLAKFYTENANKAKHHDYPVKALKQIDYVLSLDGNTIPEREVLKLRKKINSSTFSATTQESPLPNQPILTHIKAKNIDTLYVSVYKAPTTNYNYKERDSLFTKTLETTEAIHKESFKIPNSDSYYSYTTEFLSAPLKPGKYLRVFSNTKRLDIKNDMYEYHIIHITDLAYNLYDYDSKQHLYVHSKKTGLPLSNVRVNTQNNEDYITDEKGFAVLRGKNKNYSEKMLLIKGEDSLRSSVRFSKKYAKDTQDAGDIRIHILTDRSIYRPGQTLYYKVILSFQNEKERKVLSNQKLYLLLKDPNHNKAQEVNLITNEFGSASGELIIPDNNLTGSYRLLVDESFDDESLTNRSNFYEQSTTISVEEYKRPTFEVELLKLDSTYILNDSVSLKGKAAAFFGGNLSNAKVKYEINRSLNRNQLYRQSSRYIPVESTRIASGTVSTNEKGEFAIDFIAVPDSLVAQKFKPVFTYSITASITDINGETQFQRKQLKFGYHAGVVQITSPRQVQLQEDQKLRLLAKDFNDKPIKVSGQLLVYQYQKPQRIIHRRPWPTPEIQRIPKEKFLQYYPYFAYDSLDVKMHWQKEIVKTIDLNFEDQIEFDYKDWKNELSSGEYLLQFKGKDDASDSITTSLALQLRNKKDEDNLKNTEFVTFSSKVEKKTKKNFIQAHFYTPIEGLNILLEVNYSEKLQLKKYIQLQKGDNIIPIEVAKNIENVGLRYAFTTQGISQQQTKSVSIPKKKKKEKTLQFEVMSFKDKLKPGNEETWELKVVDQNNKDAEAEVLASMYDASLDQFKEHDWSIQLYQERNKRTNYAFPNLRQQYADVEDEASSRRKNFILHNYFFFSKLRYTNLQHFGYHFTNTSHHQKFYTKSLIQKDSNHENKIVGWVRDDQGLPLPGVSIIYKGTSQGTQTDFDGKFILDYAPNTILIISYIGFETQAIQVDQPQKLEVMMQGGNTLDQVVVTSFAINRKKESIAYSSETVSTEDLINPSNPDVIKDFAGKVSGLQVLSTPSGGTQIVLRGNQSVSGVNNPLLIVIDGKISSAEELKKITSTEISTINLIKGINAEALYGSQAANGVVIITTKAAEKELQQVQTRTNLQETAFFFPQLKTNEQGEVSFKFKSPEALTRWKFQAFAHDKNLHQAKLDLTSMTQKDLNILPNFPRFFRSKDSIIISAKVNNLADKNLNGIIQLEFTDELTQEKIPLIVDASSVKNFSIPSKGNAEVNWKLAIPEGLSAVRYRIVAKAGNFSDGEENVIPVFTNRIFITESLPIWLNPKEAKSFSLENLKYNKSPTLENHQLIFEYTSNPVWTAIKALPYLVEYPYDCAEQTFARFFANNLAEFLLKQNPEIQSVLKEWEKNGSLISELNKNEELKNILIQETPWLKTAQSQEEQQKRIADLLEAKKASERAQKTLVKLEQMQLGSGAFPWFTGGRENLSISLHILISMERLEKMNQGLSDLSKYQQIKNKLITYLDNEFLEIEREHYSNLQLNYLYARSFDALQSKPEIKKYSDELLKQYQEEWLSLSIQSKVTLALVAHRFQDKKLAKNILESLKQNAVINSNYGMYWKELTKSYAWFNDAIATQALAMEAFNEIDKSEESVRQLKTWLLRNKKTEAWKSTKATTEAIYVLLTYGTTKAEPEFPSIKIGDKKITPKTAEAKTGYFKTSFSSEEITPQMGQVDINNKSQTAQYGGLYWQYFEESDQIKEHQQEQISIQKNLYKKVETNEGSSLEPINEQNLNLGDIVVVRLEINAKESFSFMHLKDMRAAGLEPVDVISKYKYQDGLAFYQSTKDVATHFFFDNLRKGTYVLEYSLKVNNKGDFSNGTTRLQCLYAPEFSVQTKSTRLEIE